GGFDPKRAEALKVCSGRRADPAKEAPRQLDIDLAGVRFVLFERIRRPSRVTITLLVQASIGWNSTHVATRLQAAERHRQGRGYAFLLTGLTETARQLTSCLANGFGIERPFRKRRQHSVTELVDLLFRDPELLGGLELGSGIGLPDHEAEGKIRGRQ